MENSNIINIILKTDSYKLGHWQQYPNGMRKVYSYMESRGGLFPKTLFTGLNIYLKKYLQGIVVTMEDIDYAEKFTEENDLIEINGNILLKDMVVNYP